MNLLMKYLISILIFIIGNIYKKVQFRGVNIEIYKLSYKSILSISIKYCLTLDFLFRYIKTMLSQKLGFNLHYSIKNTLLRSLLPHVLANPQWSKFITLLSKVSNISLIVQNKMIKQQEKHKNKCPLCNKFLYQNNLFVLILHIQIEHNEYQNYRQSKKYNKYTQRIQIQQENAQLNRDLENYCVKKYQFTYDGLQIHLSQLDSIGQSQPTNPKSLPKKSTSTNNKKSDKISNSITQNTAHKKNQKLFKKTSSENYTVSNPQKTTILLNSTSANRSIQLLEKIFSKFSKRVQTISNQRKFYHSYSIFRTISPQSQDEQNSQEQAQISVQRQLQRLRINDFADVSSYDKLIFLQWNDLMRKSKKQQKIIYQQKQIVSILKQFSYICKQKKIPRLNFNIHLYTLWSVGQIQDFDITEILQEFDRANEQKIS